MKNYIFLVIAIALIGAGYFLLGDMSATQDGASSMTMAKKAAPTDSPAPITENLLSLSSLANITGILSFIIQIGVWAKSGLRK